MHDTALADNVVVRTSMVRTSWWCSEAAALTQQLRAGAQHGPYEACYTDTATLQRLSKPFRDQAAHIEQLLASGDAAFKAMPLGTHRAVLS